MNRDRRTFLTTVGRVIVTLPAGYVFAACSNTSNENQVARDAGPDAATRDAGQRDAGQRDAGQRDAGHDAGVDAGRDASVDAAVDAGPDAAVDAGAKELTFTSSRIQNHSHDFSLSLADIESPPSSGVSGDTTLAVSHVHHVSLTAAQLAQIANGSNVMVQTSVTAGHSHTFAFHK